MIDRDLLRVLCCPETHQRVALAEPSVLARVNAAITEGRLRNQSGQWVVELIEGGLIREDGRLLYPIRQRIPLMRIGEGISLDPSDWGGQTDPGAKA